MDSGSLAWVLTSAALVLFMTPGLALFYGGMDRSRSVLNMLMMNFWCILAVPVLWVTVGYTLAQNPFEQQVDRQPRRRVPRTASASSTTTAGRSPPSPSWGCSP